MTDIYQIAGHSPVDIHDGNARDDQTTSRPSTSAPASDRSIRGKSKGVVARRSNRASKPMRGPIVENSESRNADETHGLIALECGDGRFSDPVVAQIRELWRRRQSWHVAEKSLTLSASAMCRRFVGVVGKSDKSGLAKASSLMKRIEQGKVTEAEQDVVISTLPLLTARDSIKKHRVATEKELAKLAAKLPIAELIESTRGVGIPSLAAIVGEAGAIGAYRTVEGLWKRMGLAVIEGERQRKNADPIAALKHGYAPRRRSVMFLVGGCLIGATGHGPRPRIGEDMETRDDLTTYQKLFIQRLRHEAERNPEHKRKNAVRDGIEYESYSSHAANRARRYVEKRFLRDLWVAWRRAIHQSITKTLPRVAEFQEAAE